MSEVQIGWALDPDDNLVPIDAAKRKQNYYRCPECGHFLKVRKGEKRAYHFAHKRDDLEEHDCPLRTESGIRRKAEEFQTSNIEKSEKRREIQIFVKESYGSELNLFGIIPSLEWGNLEDSSEVERVLKKIKLSTEGVKDNIQPNWLHPREPEVKVDLNPEASDYRITIDSDDLRKKIENIKGKWSANGVEIGDIFIGTSNRAKRINQDKGNKPVIKEGEKIFKVVDSSNKKISEGCEVYNLDSLKVLGFKASDDNQELIEKHVGVKKTDQHSFDVDFLLPLDVDPNTESPIYGKPGSEVLVAITPPLDTDPKFEIVSIPRKKEGVKEIDRKGPGKPRFIRIQFPDYGSRRLTVHWANRHRKIHLHSTSDNKNEVTSLKEPPTIGIQLNTKQTNKFLNPLSNSTSVVLGSEVDFTSIISYLNFKGPKGYQLDVKAFFPEDVDFPSIITRSQRSFKEIKSELSTWMEEGCNRILFNFETMGDIEIRFERKQTKKESTNNQPAKKPTKKPWEEELSKKEIKKRLRKIDELPEKANWSLVRKVYRAPEGTLHEEFGGGEGGVKKLVRHALWEIKEENQNER